MEFIGTKKNPEEVLKQFTLRHLEKHENSKLLDIYKTYFDICQPNTKKIIKPILFVLFIKVRFDIISSQFGIYTDDATIFTCLNVMSPQFGVRNNFINFIASKMEELTLIDLQNLFSIPSPQLMISSRAMNHCAFPV